MAGTTRRIVSRRAFSFNDLGAGAEQTLILDRGVDVGRYRELTVLVAVHSSTAGATNTIEVLAVPVTLTETEPQTDFTASAAIATATINATQSGVLVIGAASANFGSRVQIQVHATQSLGGGTLEATLTIDVSLKE